MSRFNAEFSRLYLVPDATSPAQGRLVAADGSVKAMVLEVARPADWAELSAVWHAMQHELELPAAAIAVSGTDGLQLWFSVAEPVSAADATAFLAALQGKYLGAVPAKRIRLYPSSAEAVSGSVVHAKEVPAIHESTGNWSAFVSPDLASVFGEEPWLDIPPNQDQRADILSRLKSMKLAQFRDVLSLLRGTLRQAEAPTNASASEPKARATVLSAYNTGTTSPKEFLTQVMNDPAVLLSDRIEAAKALLPYVT